MSNFIARLVSLIAITIAFVAIAPAVRGQRENAARPNTPPGSTTQDPVRQPSIRERQYKMLEMEREAANPHPLTPEQQKLATAQIAEDFRQIQVINNSMMSAAFKARELNYANIAATTSEIKTRAVRLRDNLRLEKVDQKQNDIEKRGSPADATEFKSQLLTLDKSIMSFVENPIFKTPDVISADDATKARRDLDAVITLSGVISKAAARAKKN